MVLADDNFASIFAAVTEGQRVYDKITKLVRRTLPTGGGESSVVTLALLFGLTLPITPIQILWANLITELTLGMALALDPLEPKSKTQSPRRRSAPLLDGGLLWDIAVATALVATRFNPDMKARYQAMRETGKPAQVALTAIMRKLIELANALIRDDRKWSPKVA